MSLSGRGRRGREFEPPRQEVTYAKNGDANDVVVATAGGVGGGSSEGLLETRRSSSWSVYFPKRIKLPDGSIVATRGFTANISVNGSYEDHMHMVVEETGFCAFAKEEGRSDFVKDRPSEESLMKLKLMPGLNALHYELAVPATTGIHVVKIDAFLYFYEASAKFAVVDIDGTITKSDIPGLLLTISPGMLNASSGCHSGICRFLNWVEMALGLNIIYLTSRPLVLATKTRAFLMSLRQDGFVLPSGPMITCELDTGTIIYREIIGKDMHHYKRAALEGIKTVFSGLKKLLGYDHNHSTFVSGFGNRPTDFEAYREVGIPLRGIFIADRNSSITQYRVTANKTTSLSKTRSWRLRSSSSRGSSGSIHMIDSRRTSSSLSPPRNVFAPCDSGDEDEIRSMVSTTSLPATRVTEKALSEHRGEPADSNSSGGGGQRSLSRKHSKRMSNQERSYSPEPNSSTAGGRPPSLPRPASARELMRKTSTNSIQSAPLEHTGDIGITTSCLESGGETGPSFTNEQSTCVYNHEHTLAPVQDLHRTSSQSSSTRPSSLRSLGGKEKSANTSHAWEVEAVYDSYNDPRLCDALVSSLLAEQTSERVGDS